MSYPNAKDIGDFCFSNKKEGKGGVPQKKVEVKK